MSYFLGHHLLDGAGFQVVADALEAAQVVAVHVDFHGGTVGEVVHLVDFVDFGDEQADFAGFDHGGAVALQLGPVVAPAVVNAAEAGFGEGVVHDADHAPGAMVVGRGVVAGSPDDGGNQQAAVGTVVEQPGAVIGSAAGADGLAETAGVWRRGWR